MTDKIAHSFFHKDPSGFVYQVNGQFYRQVNKVYADQWLYFRSSGLPEFLREKQMLLPYVEIKENILRSPDWFITILPEQLTHISYPYEWCFEQMKDAALLTLEIVKLCMGKGMILKDATPFNVQFHNSRPIFIDTLSFEKYDETLPWIAYRQFCETFLFPLWLSHYHKGNFLRILYAYPDGIPLDLAAKLFPERSRFNLYVWMHVRLHNKVSKKRNVGNLVKDFSQKKLSNLVTNLEDIIRGLDNSSNTTWSNYYAEGINNPEYLAEKENIVKELLTEVSGKKVLDLGANYGHFSFIAAQKGFSVVAIDDDEQCINYLYKKVKKENIKTIFPLCIDITNPSSAGGFAYEERSSLNDRMQAEVVLALALTHHLVIGKNIPLFKLSEFLAQLGPQLIIEFVDKEDAHTQELLLSKKDIFPEYTKEGFERCFQHHFTITKEHSVRGTFRTIYLMKRKNEKTDELIS
jgi:hypothetical protein